MELDSMGRIVSLLLLVVCVRTAANEHSSEDERRSEADNYFTELRSWYKEGDTYSHVYDRGLRRKRRNIKTYVQKSEGIVRKTRHTLTRKHKHVSAKKVEPKGEWGVLKFTGAYKAADPTLSNNERYENGDFHSDHAKDAFKKDNITAVEPKLRHRRKRHRRKHSHTKMKVPTTSENETIQEVHGSLLIRPSSSNAMTPTTNPNLPFRDNDGNVVISHHSVRVHFKNSLNGSVEVLKRRIPRITYGFKRIDPVFWHSAKGLGPEMSAGTGHAVRIPRTKRDRTLRREKRSSEKQTSDGPSPLLVDGIMASRDSNNNNSANIHDFFRHVFIRNNQTTSDANNEHRSTSESPQTMENGSKKKKKGEKRKKVAATKPNISNIHDFFRHLFIRKNITESSPNKFLNSTIGAYDMAHGKGRKPVKKGGKKIKIVPRRRIKAGKKKKSQRKQKAHAKKVKSHAGVAAKVLVSASTTSHDSGDITLRVVPEPPPDMASDSKKPEKEVATQYVATNDKRPDTGVTTQAAVTDYKKPETEVATQYLRSDEVVEQAARSRQPLYPATYTTPESSAPNNYAATPYTNVQQAPLNANPGVTSNVVQTYNNVSPVISPTSRNAQWMYNNNTTSSFSNTPYLTDGNLRSAYSGVPRVKTRKVIPGSFRVQLLRKANISPKSGHSQYWKNGGVVHTAHIAVQPLVQENIGFALGEAPRVPMNPINAKIIRRKNLAELSRYHMGTEFHPADKKNLVQFRDSTGKVIATLVDPRSWNNANVTLSKLDDRRRYMNEFREMQNMGALKRHMTPRTGRASLLGRRPLTSQLVKSRNPARRVLVDNHGKRFALIPRKIAISTRKNSSASSSNHESLKPMTDKEGNRIVSYHAYHGPRIPVKRGGIVASKPVLLTRNMHAPAARKNVYDIGDYKRNYIYPLPKYNTASVRRRNYGSTEMITAVNGVEQPVYKQDDKRTLLSEDKEANEESDPWAGTVLNDNDRAYLTTVLSELRGSEPSEHVGIRRDDIPGGKNNHQILTKVTKFMGDVEKFIKNVEVISSTFGKGREESDE